MCVRACVRACVCVGMCVCVCRGVCRGVCVCVKNVRRMREVGGVNYPCRLLTRKLVNQKIGEILVLQLN